MSAEIIRAFAGAVTPTHSDTAAEQLWGRWASLSIAERIEIQSLNNHVAKSSSNVPADNGCAANPLHGVCIPCQGHCWTMLRCCVAGWHLDKGGVPGRCWACMWCTAVRAICIRGKKRDEQCVKQWAPRVPRPPSRSSVWPPITDPWARWLSSADSPATPTTSVTRPSRCYVLLFSPPLCSGGPDSCYQGRLFTLRISQWPPQPPPQHLPISTDRQGGENKLTMSLLRHLNFMPLVYLKMVLFWPEQIWLCWLFYLSSTQGKFKKIGQTPRKHSLDENGKMAARVQRYCALQRLWGHIQCAYLKNNLFYKPENFLALCYRINNSNQSFYSFTFILVILVLT